MTEGLALVLGRWLDRPGWGEVRRRVGSYLAKPRAIPEPPRLRLETPAGSLVALPVKLPGETALQCVQRVLPGSRAIICSSGETPLGPSSAVGPHKMLIVVTGLKFDISERAANNQLVLLKWAIAHGCPWHEDTSWYAATRGHLKLLQWAIAHGCPWHPNTSNTAVEHDHVDLLKWAIAGGCPWHEATSIFLAESNGLELLQWAIAHGCEWHEEMSYFAAKCGHLNLLQWAIAHGCEWHSSTSWYAARHGHLELLQWSLANGCLLSPGTRHAAAENHPEIVEWLDARADG